MTLIPKLCFGLLSKSRLCRKNISVLCTILPDSDISFKYSFTSRSLYTAMATQNKVFDGKTDRFNGVAVDSLKENCESVEQFSDKLEDSLKFWKKNGNRAIWFKVHLTHADWVPILCKHGFKFHNAREEYVMMYLWLPKTENCNIPHYAHTMIGVGAVVVNDKSQVLVVREKYLVNDFPHWKLPGGYVEPGENLIDAAIREVHEETNILTEFHSVLTLRHTHGGMFGCSDIYTVVSLKPLSENIEKCEREIAQCQWMDINEYLNHPHVHDLNRFFVQKYQEYKNHNININCFNGIHQVIKKPYTVYSVTKSDLVDQSNGDKDPSES